MEPRLTQAAQLYQSVKPATAAVEKLPAPDSAFANSLDDFAGVLRTGEQTAADAMVGKADPQALVEALAQTKLAVETAVSVRDKIVEAYQEILRMPV
jgi:flagellar hook-basal body complex protein FliE